MNRRGREESPRSPDIAEIGRKISSTCAIKASRNQAVESAMNERPVTPQEPQIGNSGLRALTLLR
jgi:hypothetical protein